MSLKTIDTPNQRPRIKLVQSLDEINTSQNIEQTSKKYHPNPLETSLNESPKTTPKILRDLQNQLKTLRLYYKKPRNLNSIDELRGKALSLIDQNNQLNSVLESDIALQYLETQDISPKQGTKSLGNSKKELIKANVELNKKLFQRFFLDPYSEKTPPNMALEKLNKELGHLNSFDKENLNYYKTSHSFIEIQSAAFLKNDETYPGYEKLVEDYKGLASENLALKQTNTDLESKITSLIDENKSLRRQNAKLLTELELLDKEFKNSKDILLAKPIAFSSSEFDRNEEFKLLDEKITQLLNENVKLKQRNSEQERTLEVFIKGQRDSSIVVSKNLEKYGKNNSFLLEQNNMNMNKSNDSGFSKNNCREIQEIEQRILKESKNMNSTTTNDQKNSNLKESVHLRCNKIIEDLKNELMEAHICIADLETKIKRFWVKKNNAGVLVKNYDVILNLREDHNGSG